MRSESFRRLQKRVEERVHAWGVIIEDSLETQSSFVAFGRRGNLPVVLKVLRGPRDEWRCGEVLDAFNGRGIVRVYEYAPGAVLLERLDPGTALSGIALRGRDDEATEILSEVIHQISHPRESLGMFATVEDWGKGFQRYLATGDNQISGSLVEQAQHLYMELCASQQNTRLLHGDLHHYNVLFDSNRGWLAIDPKGVVGETEYEIGASLRNPYEAPGLLASLETVERRLKRYEARLKLDGGRALKWGFAQAVLSAIWSAEDGYAVDDRNPSVMLANAIKPVLG
jgi:streptomycin 6-kinase